MAQVPSVVEAAQALIMQVMQYEGFGPLAEHPPQTGSSLSIPEQILQFMPHGAWIHRFSIRIPPSA